MAGHQCFHCKQWIEEGVEHDCWTTTERTLTKDLSEDLQDAWERIRETAVEFGEQRIYASHHSIMFSRKACYFFVRPKRKYLELVFFLGRMVRSPLIRKAAKGSKTKFWHSMQIVHRDQVEPPVTDWLKEAYGLQDAPAARTVTAGRARSRRSRPSKSRQRSRRGRTGAD